MQKITLICLILSSSTVFAISTKLSDVLNPGSQAIDRNRVGVPKTDAPGAHSISVTGTITSANGSIAENFTVKAFAGKMGSSQLMGSTLTDGGGAYTIAFPSNDSVTVVVKVYCKAALVATSAPEYNVTEGTSIDFTVPNSKCAPGILQTPKIGFPIQKTGS